MKRLPRTAAIVLIVLAGYLTLAASALAVERTVSGSVACQKGYAVTGVWVQSSAGGSKWADWTARSGASWLANYSAKITTRASSTTLRLDIGCGKNADGSWFSTNLTPTFTATGNKVQSALCTEAAGRARRCVWWAPTVLVGMPFTGWWDRFGEAHPKTHDTSGNWSTDIFQVPGTDVRLRVYGPAGKQLSVSQNSASRSCTGVCSVGYNAQVDVLLGGANLGYVKYGHLTAVPTTISSVTAYLGDLKLWPKHFTYWIVSNKDEVHTHFTARNVSGYACYWPRTSGTSYPVGRLIGKLGATNATNIKQACT